MQADIRKIRQKNGDSVSIKITSKTLEIYGLNKIDVERLKLTIENLGGNFKNQRIPKDTNSDRAFNIPLCFINQDILNYL